MMPSSTHSIPFNASCVIIADIDGDGKNEIVIGTYDRRVFAFELVDTSTTTAATTAASATTATLPSLASTLSVGTSTLSGSQTTLEVKRFEYMLL